MNTISPYSKSFTSILSIFLLPCLLIASQTAMAHDSPAQPQKPSSPSASYQLLQDDFDDGNADGWETSGPGTWSVDNNEYVVVVDSGAELNSNAFAGDPGWSNYTLEVDVKGDAGYNKGVLFRCNDVSNSCYYINITSDPVNIVSFGYLVNNLGVTLTAASLANSNGNWYHAKIILAGSTVQVYIDNQFLINYTTDRTTYIARGKIGLAGYNGPQGYDTVRFDNVVVTGAFTQYLPLSIR